MILTHRPRRNRKAEWARRLVREHVLTKNDLIWPLFLIDSAQEKTPVEKMPGVDRLNLKAAVKAAEEAYKLGIPAIAPFPYIEKSLRDPTGSNALAANNLVLQAVRRIKQEVPEIGIITDIALDPYTSHGHDGVMRGDEILNDDTVKILVEMGLKLAEAGADCLAPSDMMDGRIGAIRLALEENGFQNTQIMSYAAKYASSFYGPFRDAIGTNATLIGDKRTYQMDYANSDEAMREVALDIEEGADMVMVKPGMPYLDIIARVKREFGMPTFAYQVSGEYSMIELASRAGAIDGEKAMVESLTCFKRAGADGILTYFAPRVAKLLG